MAMTPHDDDREQRISNEIIVDAYNGSEECMGWYCYLEDNLTVPFDAVWNDNQVQVVGMSDEEECDREMRVDVAYTEGSLKDDFSVPLAEIAPGEVDETTAEAVADWKYWVERGYEFSEGDDDELF